MAKLFHQPKTSKFLKHQKGRTSGFQSNQPSLEFAQYAILSLSSARVKATTIEAVRRVVTRKLKRNGQVSVCVHCSLSVSKKPLEVRMGKGKGRIAYWACRIKAGQTLYTIDGVDLTIAMAAWRLAADKLSIKTTFVQCKQAFGGVAKT